MIDIVTVCARTRTTHYNRHARNLFTIVQQVVWVQRYLYTLAEYRIEAHVIISFSAYATGYVFPHMYMRFSL